MNADLMTIGQYICSVVKKESDLAYYSNDKFEGIGNLFIEYFGIEHKDIHHAMKRLLVGSDLTIQLRLIDFICSCASIQSCVSKSVELRSAGAGARIKVIKNAEMGDLKKEPLFVKDFSEHKLFIVIETIESISSGAGAELLKKILLMAKCPIILKVAFLHYGDCEVAEIFEEQWKHIDRLVVYYGALGFKTANDQYGGYDDGCVMLWEPDGMQNGSDTLNDGSSSDIFSKNTAVSERNRRHNTGITDDNYDEEFEKLCDLIGQPYGVESIFIEELSDDFEYNDPCSDAECDYIRTYTSPNYPSNCLCTNMDCDLAYKFHNGYIIITVADVL